MNVLQVLPGQSASVMQPKFAFEPATQAPFKQVPERVHSPSAQHGVSAACPPPLAQRPVSLTQLPPGHGVPLAMVPHPPPPVQLPPAFDPPEHRIGRRSPSRKMAELSGTLSAVVVPAAQSAVPAAFAVIVLITHVLVDAPRCAVLGIGSGGPNRQPAFVHFSRAHFALLHTLPAHVPPVLQSALVVHGDWQSAAVRQDRPRLVLAP